MPSFLANIVEGLSKQEGWKPRPLLKEAAQLIGCGNSGIYLISLPTGYGKTSLVYASAIATLANKCSLSTIYSSPLRSLADNAYFRWVDVASKIGLSKELIEDLSGLQHHGASGSIYLNKPVVFTTLDTLALHAFKIPPPEMGHMIKHWGKYRGHYEVSRGTLADAVVFLDEPHLAVSDASVLTAVLALIGFLNHISSTVVLMTATMPKEFEELVRKIVRNLKVLKYGEGGYIDEEFEEEQSNKNIETKIIQKEVTSDVVIDASEGNSRVAVVMNSRRRAVELYRKVTKAGREAILLHSFMLPSERAQVQQEIVKLSKSRKPFTLITTQVIEAGFDASFDHLITEAAHPTSLIQRVGRVARWDREEYGTVEIYHPPNYYPYREECVKRTIEVLKAKKVRWRGLVKDGGNLSNEISYVELINKAEEVPKVSWGKILPLIKYVKDPVYGMYTILTKVFSGEVLRGKLVEVAVKDMLDEGNIPTDASTINKLLSTGAVLGYIDRDGRERVGNNAIREVKDFVATLTKGDPGGILKATLSTEIEAVLISQEGYWREAYGA